MFKSKENTSVTIVQIHLWPRKVLLNLNHNHSKIVRNENP